MVTFHQQSSLGFEEPITSQVMSDPAILVHPPGITLWIVKVTCILTFGIQALQGH